MTWFNWSMTFPKKLQKKKIVKPFDLHVMGCTWSMTFPKKIPRLPEDLKQNVNWNQTLLNEGEVKLTPSITFLSIEVEHVDCHSSACLTQKKKKSKKVKNEKIGTRVQSAVRTLENYGFFFQVSHTNLLILFFRTLNHNQQGRVITPAFT